MAMSYVVEILCKMGRCVMVIFKKRKRRFCVARQFTETSSGHKPGTRSTEPLVVSQHPGPSQHMGLI